MLIQLTPEQIASNWDFLKTCIVTNMPMQRDHKQLDNNVLLALLGGSMQCWVEANQTMQNDEPKTEIRAVVVTQILEDELSETNSLLIYSLVGLNNMFDFTSWRKGLLTLAQFGRLAGCSNILAYTGNESILTFMRRLGANDSQRVLILPFN